MAQWDVATGSLGAKLRLIVDLISQDPVANTSRIRLRLQLRDVPSATFIGSPGDSCSISGTGISTISTTFTWASGTSVKTLIDVERTVDHNANGTFSGTYTGSIAATGTSGIGGPTTNGPRSFSTPTLVVPPNAPTGCAAVRVSDATGTVSWSQSHPSNGQATTNTIRQRANGGAWANVATISPATSASVGIAANQKLEFAVRASNSAGDSDWSNTSTPIFTTPAAPSAVAAVKDASLDITVSWTPNVGFSEHVHVVEHGTVSGGVTTWDGSPLATVTAGTSSYVDAAPDPADVHVYRVYAKNTDTGALESTKTLSNQVQLLAAPNAPTLPSLPNFADKSVDFDLTWTHNPVDTTEQTAYEVEYSTNGGSSWSTTGKVTSEVSERTFAGGTYAADVELTVRVRTWGEATTGGSDGTGASPWSVSDSVTFKTRPVATIVAPAHSSTWEQTALIVELGFSQAEAATFVNATIVLSEGATVLESRLSTTLSATLMETGVEDGVEYTLSVTVLDSNGLRSSAVESTFTVDYTEPVAAEVTATYNRDSGVAQLDVTIPAATGGEVDAVAVTITRVIDGARETVVDAYPVEVGEITFLDTTPTINGVNEYRVRTISEDGATADVTVELETSEGVWAFLSSGDQYQSIVSFWADLSPTATPSRASALVATAGREEPIGLFGENRGLQVSVSANLVPGLGSTAQEIEQLIRDAGIACYRDPTGRRMFGRVEGSVSSPSSLDGSVSIVITEAS